MEQRRKARLVKDMVTNRRLSGVRNKFVHRDRKLFTKIKAADFEEDARKGDTCTLYKHLQDLKDGKQSSLGPTTSNDGNILTDESAQLSAWKDHFSSLLRLDCVSQPEPDLLLVASSTPEAKCTISFHLYRNPEISETNEIQRSPRSLGYPCRTAEIWWGSEPSLAPSTVLHTISYRMDSKRLAIGYPYASLETERQHLLQLS